MFKIIKNQIDMVQKQIVKGMKYIQKNPLMTTAIIIIIVALLMSMQQMREGFRFKLPNLELERDCMDFGYVCCADSYAREPKLIQKCRGGDMIGDKMYYKYITPEGEIITSGLYNDYIIHAPGSYIRFSDEKLYKLINMDPTSKPANCKIVDLVGGEYEEAQSNIPVQY